MLFVHRSMQNRRAFTLIELLTVVVIIGILAGLVTAAAIRVRWTVRKSTHAIELKQLEMALEAYKERFGEYPPDSPAAVPRHIRKAFPRCTIAHPNAGSLTYETALTFWLGGMRGAGGEYIGFSANPVNPFDTTTSSRIGPFFEFDLDRLDPNTGLYYPTIEARASNNANMAVRYYRAENGTYDGKGAIPFRDSRVGTAPNFGWINPRSFQIISPGLLGRAFSNSGANPVYPTGVNYTEAHLEMMSNFTNGTMEDALP